MGFHTIWRPPSELGYKIASFSVHGLKLQRKIIRHFYGLDIGAWRSEKVVKSCWFSCMNLLMNGPPEISNKSVCLWQFVYDWKIEKQVLLILHKERWRLEASDFQENFKQSTFDCVQVLEIYFLIFNSCSNHTKLVNETATTRHHC